MGYVIVGYWQFVKLLMKVVKNRDRRTCEKLKHTRDRLDCWVAGSVVGWTAGSLDLLYCWVCWTAGSAGLLSSVVGRTLVIGSVL